MKQALLLYICVIASLLGLSSCSSDDDYSPIENSIGLPGDTLQQTIVIYMAGENSLAVFIQLDSTEIAAALPLMDEDCRVVVFIDDCQSSRICVGTHDTELQTALTYPTNICATDSAAMSNVLSYIFTTYPARHYGLVLWSHASGWVFQKSPSKTKRQSFGIDNGQRRNDLNTGLQMDIPILANVLRLQPHLDYIFFDACFMMCVEVAYELRDVASYIAGSPAEIPGDGAPYNTVLPALSNNSISPLQRITDAMQAYSDFYTTGPGYYTYRGAELSIADTQYLESLMEASSPIIQQLLADRSRPNTSSTQPYCMSSRSTTYTEFFDMQHLFYNNLPNDEYASWLQALKAAVPATWLSVQWFTNTNWAHFETLRDKENSGGISLFVPSEYYSSLGWTESYKKLQWAQDTGFDQTGW
ncbi:MAG: hypothetical protein J5486_07570 [Bacteroidaceae bacterium]|nr:hypothetical protein [Bacteroidaceae bacterium]